MEGWSKLSIAKCMTSAASKLFKGDVLVHVSTIKEKLPEAQEILKAKPAEFNLPDHMVHVDIVETIMSSIETQASQVATDALFVEFQELEKQVVNFARLMSLLPDPHIDRKRYLAFFKEKSHGVKEITSIIDKLDKQFSKVQERVEKFSIDKEAGNFVGYADKMNDFKKRLHDGDSAVSCQALVMLLSNPKALASDGYAYGVSSFAGVFGHVDQETPGRSLLRASIFNSNISIFMTQCISIFNSKRFRPPPIVAVF